ncbi:SET domain-containing protein SmydA-8-like [Frankliniella occidentalis]|uniref:SET domain-containing protein SmydA-8-like n=1 Tax=Frankliniella occidentalis TaxID=133901 RepID=A0A9C6X4F6_FRAOC|nr:SET domain-containing protein SmydA-8-like [Frankliniella occidentalis]
MSSALCVICGAPAPLKCSACKSVAYCAKEHQKQHWKTHKTACRPFEVDTSPELGRHLVATRDVAADAVLLTEAPLVAGPRHHDNPRGPCLGCLQPLPADVAADAQAMCPGCLWPACSADCPGLRDALSHLAECRVLQAGRHVVLQDDLRYDALLPLRCLLLQKTSPAKWRTLQAMDANMAARGPGTLVHQETQDRVVTYLRENFLRPLSVIMSGSRATPDRVEGLLEDCSESTLHRIVGVLDVNALEISSGLTDISALYPTAYLMEHSCVPNTRHSFTRSASSEEHDARFRITLRSATDIKKGEHISTMYTHMLWGTMARREHLLAVKGFPCRCRRCADPRELGSLLSALRCLACGAGNLLPSDPLDDNADWRCDACGAPLAAEHVIQVVSSLDEQVGQAMEGAGGADALEGTVAKLEKLLHPHHYHCLQVKHSLLQLYGGQLEMSRLSAQQLQRKASLSREVLGVLLQLDPPLARLQLYAAVCLLELQRADLEALKRAQGEAGTGTAANTRAALQDMRALLQRATHALRFETADEGARMVDAIKTAQQEMEVWARVNKVA